MEKALASEGENLRLRFLQKFAGLTEDESKDLAQLLTSDTPEEWVEERPIRGGGKVKYVPGPYFIKRFNDAFGFLWNYEVPEYFERDGQIVAKGRWSFRIPGRTITRKFPDGTEETIRFDGMEVVKEQFGSSEIKRYSRDVKNPKTGEVTYKKGDVIDLGDDYKAASTDAMKKCGTQLGLFPDIYSSRAAEEERGISKQQLEVLYMRGRNAGMDEQATLKWAEEELGKPLSAADQLEAMSLIPKLVDLAKERRK
jgi:hypothetical protein